MEEVQLKKLFTILLIIKDVLHKGKLDVAISILQEQSKRMNYDFISIEQYIRDNKVDLALSIIDNNIKEIGLRICQAKITNTNPEMLNTLLIKSK